MKRRTYKKRVRESAEKPVSLKPLKFEEALAALLKTTPPKPKKGKKVKKKK